MRTLLAWIPALAFVALPQPAAAFELPNGDVVWDVATADYDVRIEQTHGSELGSMILTNRATGEIQHGDLSPAFIYDRDGSQGLLDEFYARGLFAGMLIVEVELYDKDGTAFDGATVKPGYPAALMIPSPPPLALFETARVTFSVNGKDGTSTRIVALPEPSVAALVLLLLGSLLLRRQRPHRLVHCADDGR